MTTPEIRTPTAGSELPISAAELSRLAGQIYAELTPLQVSAPAAGRSTPSASAAPSVTGTPTAPPAPRGSAPGSDAASSAAHLPAGSAGQGTPLAYAVEPSFDPASIALSLPGPDSPPYTVPVAPRGSAPGAGAAASAPAAASLAPAAGIIPSTPTAPFGGPAALPTGLGASPPAPIASAASGPPSTLGSSSAPNSTSTRPSAPPSRTPSASGSPLTPASPSTLDSPSASGFSAPNTTGTPAGGVPSWPSIPLGQADRTPAIPGLTTLLAPWASPAPVQPGEFYELGDHRRSGALPPNAVKVPTAEFDVHAVRKDFPILSETVNGHPLIWFDNAATTQKPQAVIDRLAYFYAHENSNIHRAAHELAARATDAYEDARDTVRDFLGASRSEEIVFVRGTTEAINLVAQSWGRKNLSPGDEILITHLEHHANIVPWQMVAQQTGAVLKVAPVDDRGTLLLDEFSRLLGPKTKLVSATQVANAVGTVNPVETIVELAHKAGARVLIDGAQSVPHLAVDLQRLDADFFVFSGHKIFGPTGIGVVYIAERMWEETPPWQGGGNMIADVTHERAIYQGPPNKYEAGTGNIADAVGLAAALRYVNDIGIERIAAYEHFLLDYATPRLAAIPGVTLIGTADHKASVLSFVLKGYEAEEVGKALNERGIAVRAGHHCAQPILRRLGVEKTVRPSFAFYNTTDEIDVFLDAVRDLSARTK